MATTTRKNAARKFSPEQSAYIAARARVEWLQEELKREMARTGLAMETEAEIDAYCDAEEEVRARLGLDAAYDAERAARTALFAWGHAKVKRLPQYRAVAGQIADLYDRIDRHPYMAERLVEITMQLKA